MTDILYFDTETTGLPPRGADYHKDYKEYPYIVQIAWSIGDKTKSYIIRPNGWIIPPEVVEVHGITTERALSEGIDMQTALSEFFHDAYNAKYVCAHNIYFDTSIIKANVLKIEGQSEFYDNVVTPALDKGKRIDTMRKTIKFVNATFPDGRAGKFPKLEELYAKIFQGETFPAHDALEDVKALRRCAEWLIKKGIITLPNEQTTSNNTSTEDIKTKLLNENEF